jgi:hypothetical protein
MVTDAHDIELAVLRHHLSKIVICAESKLFDIHSIPDPYETPPSLYKKNKF